MNDRAAALLGRSNDGLLGHDLGEFVAAADLGRFRELIGTAGAADARIEFLAATGAPIPMHVWASRLDRADDPLICLVATDLSRVETDRKLIAQLEELLGICFSPRRARATARPGSVGVELLISAFIEFLPFALV